MRVDRFCNECGCLLTSDNWWPSSQKRQWHKCGKCCHARNALYDRLNPHVSLRKNIKKYGIDDVEYEALVKKQKGVCAICKQVERIKGRKRLAVDHDHTTGKVRGLLCNSCNIGIGKFQDDIKQLEAAVEYLKSWT